MWYGRLIMRGRNPRKPISGLLCLAFVLFVLGQGTEILHPLEEERHLPHHGHVGTVYHEPLPCDSGEQHSHFCLHGQQFTPALCFLQGSTDSIVKLALWAKSDWVSSFQYSRHTIRAPPFFS